MALAVTESSRTMQPPVIPQPRTPAIPYHRGSGVQTILRMDLSEIPHGRESAARTPQRHIAAGANRPKPKSACPEITALWSQCFWVRNADNSIRIRH